MESARKRYGSAIVENARYVIHMKTLFSVWILAFIYLFLFYLFYTLSNIFKNVLLKLHVGLLIYYLVNVNQDILKCESFGTGPCKQLICDLGLSNVFRLIIITNSAIIYIV